MVETKQWPWVPTFKHSQPLWKSREETHELLSEDESRHHIVLNSSYALRWSGFSFPLRRLHVRILGLILVLIIGLIVLLPHEATPPILERPRWPWDDFRL